MRGDTRLWSEENELIKILCSDYEDKKWEMFEIKMHFKNFIVYT